MKKFKILSESTTGMPVLNYHVAGIDVGTTEMWITYTNAKRQTCQFMTGSCTQDLSEIVETFLSEGVTAVAMESTGIYGDPLRSMLENAGIRVTVINPALYKKPDLKTDGKDSIWLHQYHSVGLFKDSHYAKECWRELREYIQEREVMQNHKSQSLVKISRQLSMMNVKLPHFVSDIEGVNAMRVLRAIAAGNFDPEYLVSLIDLDRMKSDKATLLKSLEGDFRPYLINVFKEKLAEYDFYVSQMKKYETYMTVLLEEISRIEEEKRIKEQAACSTSEESEKSEKSEKPVPHKKKARKNEYDFDGADYLNRITGIDLTAIDGLEVKTLLIVLSVTGIDMSKWKNAEAFVSWLCLAPRPNISNGQLKGYDRRKSTNPATQALRVAVRSLHNNNGHYGHMYRRIQRRKGSIAANKAVARHLAILIYTLLKNHTEYDENFHKEEKQKQKKRNEKKLLKLAEQLGYDVSKKASLSNGYAVSSL
jgi:hypothetical protein